MIWLIFLKSEVRDSHFADYQLFSEEIFSILTSFPKYFIFSHQIERFSIFPSRTRATERKDLNSWNKDNLANFTFGRYLQKFLIFPKIWKVYRAKSTGPPLRMTNLGKSERGENLPANFDLNHDNFSQN